MKKLIFLLALLCNNQLSAQYTFEKYYKPTTFHDQWGIQLISDGKTGYYLGSMGNNYNALSNNYATLTRFNEYGDTLWVFNKYLYTIGSATSNGGVNSIALTSDRGVLLCGWSQDTTLYGSSDELFTLKVDSSGSEKWYHGFADDPIYIVAEEYYHNFMSVLPNKNIFINFDGIVSILLDSIGNFITKKYLPFSSVPDNLAAPNLTPKDSGYVKYGRANITSGPNDSYIFKLSNRGDSISSVPIEYDSCLAGCFVASKESGYYFNIRRKDLSLPDKKVYISKIDSTGHVLWLKSYLWPLYNSPAGMRIYAACASADSGVVFTGAYPKAPNSLYNVAYMFKLDTNGDSVWFKSFKPAYASALYSVFQTPDGGYAACGQYSDTSLTPFTNYILKTDGNGYILNAGPKIQEKNQSYLHIYPNPANSYTSIHCIGEQKNARLNICNLEGRVLYTEFIKENDVRININTTAFQPGFYFCTLVSDGVPKLSKKLVVLR